MCVGTYRFIHVYIYIYICVFITWLYTTYACSYFHVTMSMFIYVGAYRYANIYIYIFICIYAYTYIHILRYICSDHFTLLHASPGESPGREAAAVDLRRRGPDSSLSFMPQEYTMRE